MAHRLVLIASLAFATSASSPMIAADSASGITSYARTPHPIVATNRCDTPWGMTIEPMFDAEGGHWGVRISGIRDGRAKTAGLLEDDIIIKANDHIVGSTQEEGAPQRLVAWFRALPCEKPVNFVIVRGTTRMEIAAPGLKP